MLKRKEFIGQQRKEYVHIAQWEPPPGKFRPKFWIFWFQEILLFVSRRLLRVLGKLKCFKVSKLSWKVWDSNP